MPRLVHRDPRYRLYRASGQAVVTLNGHCYYLGPHGSDESGAEYARLIAEWKSSRQQLSPASRGTSAASDLTIAEVAGAFWKHIETYYIKDGDLQAYLFSPKDAEAERYAACEVHRSKNRKPNPRKSKRVLGDRYTADSYRRIVHGSRLR